MLKQISDKRKEIKKIKGCCLVYHAIENTTNQNKGKSFCIRQYYNQHSQLPLSVYRIGSGGHCFPYGMVKLYRNPLSRNVTCTAHWFYTVRKTLQYRWSVFAAVG